MASTDMASAVAGPTSAFRVTLLDTASGEELWAQANPDQLSEQIGAEYASTQVPGLSHTVRQFSNTTNLSLEFDLVFWAESRADLAQLQYARRFLHSVCYPRRATAGAQPSRPPRVTLIWPGTMLITGIVTSVKFKHDRFNREGTSVGFTASVSFEECRTERIASEDVFDDTEQRIGGA